MAANSSSVEGRWPGTQALNVTNTTENQTQNPRALDFFNITPPNGFNSDMRSHPIAVTHDVPQ
ncbi:hypothetical protein AB9F29_13790 [Falsihalocynthiibacter sp. S25ZX9]|uniref:hypothetical protein n=1 Tax=Falsihalocynthiibacter sp. S25ZX9 TaxID=3240870 RepID=UPI0035107C01